jgi:hypothetical protein
MDTGLLYAIIAFQHLLILGLWCLAHLQTKINKENTNLWKIQVKINKATEKELEANQVKYKLYQN